MPHLIDGAPVLESALGAAAAARDLLALPSRLFRE